MKFATSTSTNKTASSISTNETTSSTNETASSTNETPSPINEAASLTNQTSSSTWGRVKSALLAATYSTNGWHRRQRYRSMLLFSGTHKTFGTTLETKK